MFQYLEKLNEEVWAGHSTVLEDATHAVGGIGVGLLVCSTLSGSRKTVGLVLIAASIALHLYAMATATKRIRLFCG